MAPFLVDYGFYASLPAHLGRLRRDVVPLVNGVNCIWVNFYRGSAGWGWFGNKF